MADGYYEADRYYEADSAVVFNRLDTIEHAIGEISYQYNNTIGRALDGISAKADVSHICVLEEDVRLLKEDVESLKQILIGIYDKLESVEMLRMNVGADELAGLIMGEK